MDGSIPDPRDAGGGAAPQDGGLDGATDADSGCGPGKQLDAGQCVPEDTSCDLDCGDHGNCEDDACVCAEGYVGAGCDSCDSGWVIQGDACVKFVGCPGDLCSPGEVECLNGVTRTCEVDSEGCAAWGLWEDCGERCTCPIGDEGAWVEQWGGPESGNGGRGAAFSPDGALLVSGGVGDEQDDQRAFVADLSTPPPADPWIDRWSDFGRAYGMAVDEDDNVFVASTHTGPSFDGDGDTQYSAAALIKWDAARDREWAVEWDSDDDDEAWDVAQHPSGSLVVVGRTRGALDGSYSGSSDAFASLVSATGNVLWTKQWGTGLSDGGHAVTVTPTGAIYMVGVHAEKAFCRKLNDDGDEEWTTYWESNSYGSAWGVVPVPSSDDVIVVGGLQTPALVAGEVGSFVSRVAPSGDKVWTEYFSAPMTSTDLAAAVTVSPSGRLFVAGQTNGELVTGQHVGSSDPYVQEWTFDGERLWTQQLGGTGADQVFAIVADENDLIHVVGGNTGSFAGLPQDSTNNVFILYVPALEGR